MTAMRQPPATRRFARELALRALYQADVLEEPAAKAFADVLEEPSPLDPDEIVVAEGAVLDDDVPLLAIDQPNPTPIRTGSAVRRGFDAPHG